MQASGERGAVDRWISALNVRRLTLLAVRGIHLLDCARLSIVARPQLLGPHPQMTRRCICIALKLPRGHAATAGARVAPGL